MHKVKRFIRKHTCQKKSGGKMRKKGAKGAPKASVKEQNKQFNDKTMSKR